MAERKRCHPALARLAATGDEWARSGFLRGRSRRLWPARSVPAYLLEEQLVVVGLHDAGALLAEIAGFLPGSFNRAGQDHLDPGMRLAQPCGKHKPALVRQIHRGENDIDILRAMIEQLPRLNARDRFDNAIPALPQVFGERVPDEEIALQN